MVNHRVRVAVGYAEDRDAQVSTYMPTDRGGVVTNSDHAAGGGIHLTIDIAGGMVNDNNTPKRGAPLCYQCRL
jgi:hypothetical protein